LQKIKQHVTDEFEVNIAAKTIRDIVKTIRRLEMFPASGQMLSGKIDVAIDYYYIYSQKNYVFYRIEKECVKIIRVINEKQDYVQILFGISEV